jgi:hypothetical protein
MLMSRVFYGWWLTLALAAMVFVSTGIIDERPRAVPQPA